MEIKKITGTRGSITVEIDDKFLLISGELTITPVFYADKKSIEYWEKPFDKIKISEEEKKQIISLIEAETRQAEVPIIFD